MYAAADASEIMVELTSFMKLLFQKLLKSRLLMSHEFVRDV